MTKKTVLVIAPHGLDEVLGCGGVMAGHAAAGDRVEVLLLFGDGTGRDVERRKAAAEAAGILRVNAPMFGGFPENRSDTLPLLDIIAVVESRVASIKPEIVYIPHSGNLNIDHQTTFRAAVTALRPVPGSSVRAIYTYEIPSSTDWAPRGMGEAFRPVRFVDIASTLKRKMQALEVYAAEMRPAPHARSIEAVHALAAHRGATVGFAAAEAFDVVRDIATLD